MTWLVYVPLLLPALLLPLARLAVGAARPERAARALAAGALITAALGTACLLLVVATLVDDLPVLERYERHALALGHVLPEPVPDPVAVAALLLLAWLGWRLTAEVRGRRQVARELHAAGAARDGLLIADWDSPRAVAVPARRGKRGHILVTSGLLRLLDARERAAVLAHEHAHLSRRHHRTAAFAAAAAAVNPLLRPVESAVGLLVERSADEDAAATVDDRRLVARTVAKVALAAHGQDWSLGFGGSSTVRRVEALTRPDARHLRCSATVTGTVLLAGVSVVVAALVFVKFAELSLVWLPGL